MRRHVAAARFQVRAPCAWRRLSCALLWLVAVSGGLGCEPSSATTPPDVSSGLEEDGFDAPDAESGSETDGAPGELHVLFIGNSYTYVNDLPGMLARIASTAGAGPTILTDEVVQGGATLHSHWDAGLAQARIDERTWTHVVLQGQSQEAGSDDFNQFANQLGDLILGANARPTLFVTWARAAGDPDYSSVWYDPEVAQDLITVAYANVARQVPGSILSCVGEAFRASLRHNPEIVLHESDHSHPTVAGTYLAASTFYVALTGNPVPPGSEVPAEVSPQEAEALQEEALVGSECSQVRAKGELIFPECTLPGGCNAFDFGVAGTPVPVIFVVRNAGWDTVGMMDGLTLGPPFGWTSGAYPGGSGTVDASGLQFCSTSLPPGDWCALSVSYQGTAEGYGALTLDVSGGYDSTAVREMHGSSTTRALLTISPKRRRLRLHRLLCHSVVLRWLAGAAEPGGDQPGRSTDHLAGRGEPAEPAVLLGPERNQWRLPGGQRRGRGGWRHHRLLRNAGARPRPAVHGHCRVRAPGRRHATSQRAQPRLFGCRGAPTQRQLRPLGCQCRATGTGLDWIPLPRLIFSETIQMVNTT
jgi:hypothetical protein